MYTLDIPTKNRTEFIETTAEVQAVVTSAAMNTGVVVFYVPHTTAGCTINENADPDVVRDMLSEVNKIVPFESDYHHSEGNSAAHIKASLFGSSVTVLVEEGRLVLGTWQGIYFCEFDGPRRRKALVQLLRSH